MQIKESSTKACSHSDPLLALLLDTGILRRNAPMARGLSEVPPIAKAKAQAKWLEPAAEPEPQADPGDDWGPYWGAWWVAENVEEPAVEPTVEEPVVYWGAPPNLFLGSFSKVGSSHVSWTRRAWWCVGVRPEPFPRHFFKGVVVVVVVVVVY